MSTRPGRYPVELIDLGVDLEQWVRYKRQLAPSTCVDYKWRLAHLLPFFAGYRLDQITFDLVEQYIAGKLAEDEPLSARSINMTLTLMRRSSKGRSSAS